MSTRLAPGCSRSSAAQRRRRTVHDRPSLHGFAPSFARRPYPVDSACVRRRLRWLASREGLTHRVPPHSHAEGGIGFNELPIVGRLSNGTGRVLQGKMAASVLARLMPSVWARLEPGRSSAPDPAPSHPALETIGSRPSTAPHRRRARAHPACPPPLETPA